MTTGIEATRPLLFFDHFRVPYTVRPAEEAVVRLGARRLRWSAGALLGAFRLRSAPIFASVLPDALARDRLGPGWDAVEPLLDTAGDAVAHVWRSRDGDVFLPFDPDEVMRNFWSEGYHRISRPSPAARILKLGRRPYYRVRALLPRRIQIALRRRFSRVQARTAFPAWPAETALDEFHAFMFELAGELAGEPIPWIAPWPDGHEWAIVLTHDVETDVGYRHMHPLCEVERAAGFRSSFNLVPGRYRVDDADVEELVAGGFEIGAHSMRHDGREFASRESLDTWLPEMKEHARRWDAVGFRSPSTNRVWEWMPLTGFDYDSSYPDSDPFEPTPGGCCSWLPFFNEDQVELPVTLPQDHLVFVILERRDEALWVEKAEFLRERGGMALMIVHPDYMLDAGARRGVSPLPRALRRRSDRVARAAARGKRVVAAPLRVTAGARGRSVACRRPRRGRGARALRRRARAGAV